MSLLAITVGFVYAYRRITERRERFATITGRGYRPQSIDLGAWRYAASAAAVLILCLIVLLPLAVLVLTSLLPYYAVPTRDTLAPLTPRHYAFLVQSDRVGRALQVCATLAVVGASLAIVLATAVAYITVRTNVPGRAALEVLTFIPLAFPGTALAIGLLWGYVRLPIHIYGTIWILLIAYVTRFLPFGLRARPPRWCRCTRISRRPRASAGPGSSTLSGASCCPCCARDSSPGGRFWPRSSRANSARRCSCIRPGRNPLGPLLYHLWIDGQQGRMATLGVVVSVASLVLVAVVRRVTRVPLID